jgi:hypothetical protein
VTICNAAYFHRALWFINPALGPCRNIIKQSVDTFIRASYILFGVDMVANSRSRPQSVTVAIAIRISTSILVEKETGRLIFICSIKAHQQQVAARQSTKLITFFSVVLARHQSDPRRPAEDLSARGNLSSHLVPGAQDSQTIDSPV